MKKKPIIIGIGELLWDVLPTGKKAGGAPINFVYHASRLGAESYAISAVGNDPLGDEIMHEILKIDIGYLIQRVNYPTGTVLVKLKGGIPNYTIIENVAWDHIPLTEDMKQLAKRADAICFGTLAQRSKTSRKTIQTLLSFVSKDAYRIFDINIRQHYYSKEIIVSSLRNCNVFKINDDELLLIKKIFEIDTKTETDACKWFVETFNLKYMILTAGADYSAIYTFNDVSYIKTPKVEVADTVGAGDSFMGAFISSILDGKTLVEAHQVAVSRAAFVCTQVGAWVSISF
ncbi:ATP-dependent 6-phosphofructokinase [anaerobic digester metagenome]|jgi:fructokinase|uniref:carbohydrate kinase family protein n=1 Tax=Petrimonas sp. TaxID=2023866 RepID=UPI0030D58925